MLEPSEIILHKISRTLEIKWADGTVCILPCHYLRLHSPSAESKLLNIKNTSQFDHVNILAIEPIGNYAVRLVFSDGHRTGIYSWETLFQLGRQYEATK